MTIPWKKALLVAIFAACLASPATSAAQSPHPVQWAPSHLGFGTPVGTTSGPLRVNVYPNYDCGEGWAPPQMCTPSYGILDVAISGPFVIAGTDCRYQGENWVPCYIDVVFTPPSQGLHQGFLRVTQNSYERPHVHGVTLSGQTIQALKKKPRCNKKKKRCKRKLTSR
jgi:hypothetical protein